MIARAHELPPSPAYSARRYAYAPVRGAFFCGVLVVQLEQSGRELPADVYAVEETQSEQEGGGVIRERYFLVKKCGPPADTDDSCGLYLVTVPHSKLRRPSCRCFGYNRWQDCKHSASLADLLGREEL